MKKNILLYILPTVLLIFFFQSSKACCSASNPNISWTGNASTSWLDPNNWDSLRVPTATDRVQIPDVSLISGNFPIIDDTISPPDGILIEKYATMTIDTNGSLTYAGNNNGMSYLYGIFLKDSASFIVNGGTLNTASMKLCGANSLFLINSGNVVYDANVGYPNDMRLGYEFGNTLFGTIRVNDGSLVVNSKVTNDGIVELNGGTATTNKRFINKMSLIIGATGVWTNNDTLQSNANSTVTVSTGTTLTLSTGTYDFNHMIISSGGIFSQTVPNITVSGNWTNNGTYTHNGNKVTLDGGGTRTIGGANPTVFQDLTINKTTALNITLGNSIDVEGVLTLTKGYLVTTTANILNMKGSSSCPSSSASSFVNGPMTKYGNTAFTFPVGSGTINWARIGISTPHDAPSNSTFKAQYFYSDYGDTTMASSPSPVLNHVSNLEYWQLDRTTGSGNAKVTLYWENAWNTSKIWSCDNSDLRIAHYNGTDWENNNDAVTTTGTCTGATSGTITTSADVTSFSPFTFGSKSSIWVNPLPVELLSFDAALNQNQVNLKWKTASELNNDYFTIERSKDGKVWQELKEIDGAGNSTKLMEYDDLDCAPIIGMSYYRLKQTDFNGEYSYSNIVPIKYTKQSLEDLSDMNLFPNPVKTGENLTVKFDSFTEEEVLVVLKDIQGKEFYSKVVLNTEDGVLIAIPIEKEIPPGMYLVTATSGNQVFNKKVLIK